MARHHRLTLIALTLVGLTLRLWQINASLWYDEAFSAWLAQLPLQNLITATLNDVHPPLYYLVLWLLTQLWGSSVFALRLPSLIAGIALIPLVYDLCRVSKLDRRATWTAVGIVTVAPFQIYYSQEARSYALLTFAITAAAIALLKRRWLMLCLASLFALYLHNLGVIYIGCVFAMGLWVHRGNLKPLIGAGLAVAVGFLPGVWVIIYQAGAVGQGYWVLPISFGRVLSTLDDLFFYMPMSPFTVSGFVTAFGIILILVDSRSLAREYLPLVGFALLPIAAVGVLSLTWQPVWISRVVAPAAPFYYTLLAISATRTPRRLVAWGVPVAVILIFSLGSMLAGSIGRQPAAGSDMLYFDEYKPGDAIYHASVGSYVITHYYRPDLDQYLYEQTNDIEQTLTTTTKVAMRMEQADFRLMACHHPRWWFITYHNPTTSQAEIGHVEWLLATYPNTKKATLRDDRMAHSVLYLVEPVCQ